MLNIKWGVYVRQPAWSVDQIREYIHKIEDLGYHGVYTNDHLLGFDEDKKRMDPYLEAMTFMTMVLGWTRNLHVGHTVLCQSYRHPALLAKMVATADFMSEGRFDLLLGAGWNEEEYSAYGLPFPSVKTRFEQLEEYVHIVRQMLDPNVENWSFTGKFWDLQDNRNFPKPQHHIPIHVGGTKPKITKLAAKIADGYNTVGSMDQARKIFQIYDKEVERLGADSKDKIKSFFSSIYIFKDKTEVLKHTKTFIKRSEDLNLGNEEKILANHLWGTPEMLVGKLRQFVSDTSVEFFQLAFRGSVDDPLAVFWDEIRPYIK